MIRRTHNPWDDSPDLFSFDLTDNETVKPPPTTRSSGRTPAKVLEITIPLRKPTQPTLVTGKSAEKRDNAELLDHLTPKFSEEKQV